MEPEGRFIVTEDDFNWLFENKIKSHLLAQTSLTNSFEGIFEKYAILNWILMNVFKTTAFFQLIVLKTKLIPFSEILSNITFLSTISHSRIPSFPTFISITQVPS